MAIGSTEGTGQADPALAACPACRRVVTLEDDFARVRDTVYHLSCLLTALRDLGHHANGNGRPSP